MDNKVVTIKHITGTYELKVTTDELTEVRRKIVNCISGNMYAFSDDKTTGKEIIYPADLLRNSVITIEDEVSTDVNLTVDHNF